MIVNLTEDTFNDFLASTDGLVVVDFWAEWCGPCKMMLPVLEKLAEEYAGKVTVAKVNVDEEQALAEGITSIPTIRVYQDSRVVNELIGAKPFKALVAELEL